MPLTSFLAPSSFPHKNMVGFPSLNCGLTMRALPTELKALTKRTAGNSRCRRSIKDSSRVVKNFSTPLVGGASAIGFVASMTGFPARLAAPAERSASAATVPLTANTISSANFAASTNVPTRPLACCDAHSANLAGVRVPTMTSCPCFKNPAASAFPTSPDPRIPTFMVPPFHRAIRYSEHLLTRIGTGVVEFKSPSILPFRPPQTSRDRRSDKVIVVAETDLFPFLIAESASRSFFGEGFEVASPRRTGRKENQHRCRLVGFIAKTMQPALRDVEKIARPCIDPAGSIEQPHRPGQDEERFRHGSVEMGARPKGVRLRVPAVQVELSLCGGSGGQVAHLRAGLDRQLGLLIDRTERCADFPFVTSIAGFRI